MDFLSSLPNNSSAKTLGALVSLTQDVYTIANEIEGFECLLIAKGLVTADEITEVRKVYLETSEAAKQRAANLAEMKAQLESIQQPMQSLMNSMFPEGGAVDGQGDTEN